MKRIYKTIILLLLALTMVVGGGTISFAADSAIIIQGQESGFAFQPSSEYSASDLFNNFKDAMPGDKLTENIRITNKATDCDYINLYLRAQTHDDNGNPLIYSEIFEAEDGNDQAGVVGQRDETIVTMQNFLSQLSMKVYNGGTLIHEASASELGGLKDNVLLGTLRNGEAVTLTVELEVPIELSNEYANRVGEVDWVFLVEAFDDPEETPDTEDTPDSPDLPPLIQTGQLNWPILVLIGLGFVLIVVGIVFSRKRKEEHA